MLELAFWCFRFTDAKKVLRASEFPPNRPLTRVEANDGNNTGNFFPQPPPPPRNLPPPTARPAAAAGALPPARYFP